MDNERQSGNAPEATVTQSSPRPAPRPRSAFRLGNLLLALLRRLLYLIVRTQVTPETSRPFASVPRMPLCYVLQDRHLSSLLVLEEEAQRLGLPSALTPIGFEFPGSERAVFSVILNRNPLSTRTAEPSATLAQMTAAVLRDPALDAQLMPVTVLWGRSPGSQDSLVKALFADAWASVGPLRQLLIIVLHGRQTRVSFGEPISLRRLIDEETDAATAVRKANRFLRFHFRRMRESAIGPDLSHRRNLIQTMVASDALQEAIAKESGRLGVTMAAAEDRARRFAWEIASDFSYPVVRAMENSLLERLWQRLYDGIEVHHGERARQGRAGQGARLSAQPPQPHRLPAAVVSRPCAGARAAAHRGGREPEFPARGPAAAARRRVLPAPQLQGRAAVCRGVPRVPARDAGEGIPDRVLHRGRPQPQRADARRRRVACWA